MLYFQMNADQIRLVNSILMPLQNEPMDRLRFFGKKLFYDPPVSAFLPGCFISLKSSVSKKPCEKPISSETDTPKKP